MEFLIFASHREDDKLSSVFFSMNELKLLYLHFQEIEKEVTEKTFMIAEDKHNEIIVMGINEYKSALTTQPRGEKSQSYFSFYFKLGHDQVNKIYHMLESKNIIDGRNPHGGNWKRTPFISKESYFSNLLPDVEGENGKENSLEFKNRKNKITAFELLESDLLQEENNPFTALNKINTESAYKRFLVNKAIGQSIARNNLSLKARYNIPDIEILVSLFRDMIKETSLSANFILLTTIFGIRSEKLIYAVAGVDTHIKYDKKNGRLRINAIADGKIFSAHNLPEESTKKIYVIDADIYLSEFVIRIWEETRRMLSEKYAMLLQKVIYDIFFDDPFYDKFLEIIEQDWHVDRKHNEVIKILSLKDVQDENKNRIVNLPFELANTIEEENKQYFKKYVANNAKNIIFNFQTLSTLFLYLFKTRHSESDIYLLFSGILDKNDESRICYAAVPARLHRYEKWQKELLSLLDFDTVIQKKYGLSNTVDDILMGEEWIGSKLYVKDYFFKRFLLHVLSLQFEDPIDTLNSKMIFLKYALSCVMAARNFKASISMQAFSKREKTVFIQEKGKNIFSSKRIIPLTDRGVELVEQFLLCKEQYRLKSHYPVFLEKDSEGIYVEKDMSKTSITEWVENKTVEENRGLMQHILQFVSYTPLNFGRHIFTTYAIQSSEVESKHIDAFLNHYKMGTEDQGGFSNFHNQKYFNAIRTVMRNIESLYIPEWKNIW